MASAIAIPKRIPLLLVADNVLLPGSSMRIPVNSLKNMNMVKSRLMGRNTLSSTVIGVIPNVSPSQHQEDEDLSAMHTIGTAAVVVQITGTNWPRPAYTLLVTGICRFRVETLLQENPYPVAVVTQLDNLPAENSDDSENPELSALAENFREQAARLVELLDISIPVVARLKKLLASVPSEHLPDICSTMVKASYSEKLQVLDAVDLIQRFKKALPLLMRQIEGLKLLKKAGGDGKLEIVTRKEARRPENMRKVFQNLERISEEDVDDGEEDIDDIEDMEQKIKSAELPPHAHRAAVKELRRLKKMPQHMPEHAMIRNYLELMLDLPWNKSSKDCLDITQARKDLDCDHYGLKKVKKRVLEYLAVRQIKTTQLKGPILCFVGPPGVGKTSVGRSIAATLGREFHRIALGGVCDQSDIRGHRRTYIGSMPGCIIQGLRSAGTNNPVFLLDEIDKMSASLHGDPAAALLEVLDPEQNHNFVDHYLNVSFDLSQVLFIATANTVTTIPAALLDRMELLTVPGYTVEEKVHIAQQHLMTKQLQEHGLTVQQLLLPQDTLRLLITKYTREAGVRTLERRIAAICRAVAVRIMESKPDTQQIKTKQKESVMLKILDKQDENASMHPPEMPIIIDEAAVEDILGIFGHSLKEELESSDIHIHFPAGAVGKDGPSAGVTVITVLVSLFSSICVRSDTAMTGEITLRGLVLPVGGVKEKVLAAHRAGLSRVILPARNEKDLYEIPSNIKKDLSIILASRMEDVLNAALENGLPALVSLEKNATAKL